MSEISQLSPRPVWAFFDQICAIPHPSYHESQLAQFIIDWAKGRGLDVRQDKAGNLFIRKPATPGMENRKGVVLQAHLDMVPQKNENTDHDFTRDPIRPYVDGDWVTADGTTLGADNGMGMASCLAVLDADDIEHGPLEVLLTTNEEAGMDGAFGLEAGWLEGDILLNTDSEQEGEVYMGCAGGVDASMHFPLERQSVANELARFTIGIKGLKGGHSGVDIHTGRANANKLLARLLSHHLGEVDMSLIAIRGGTLRNAIPREAFADIAVPVSQKEQLAAAIDQFAMLMKDELDRLEGQVTVIMEASDNPIAPLTRAVQSRLLAALNAAPNGVVRMSDDVPGVVETSLNLGVINTEDDKITALFLIRSLIDSGRERVQGMLQSLASLANVSVTFSGAYPGWKPDPDSQIMHIFRDTYEGIYQRKPDIMVIHAGLECGLFKQPYPTMDMISFGPTIKFPHSPDEKVDIKSVGHYWQQMQAILKAIPAKAD
ncbi:aminoacyl-histidine dipeptidase [Salinivibrio sp. ES.052]|uniref:aminoacyl-histidine dipeptidase n=1 Tax=Salinivibrio sp. ES.052 TaxID=1882823 RepID=UPI00092A8AFF|nr:aminoacyl-histidine dipeptidase [Salinivibrio sp. ES.052]SIN99419.1 Xaa-His dipeptidase Metallo peptidase. MEROPS family M20C [Salinivibrio sp. ES.052]